MNFQRWCQEDGRDMPSWPPGEETPEKEGKKSRRDQESDEDSDDESDDSYDWDQEYPEQYKVTSDPMPAEATMSRPISYLVFSTRDTAKLIFRGMVKAMSSVRKSTKLSPLQEAVLKNIKENRKLPRIALSLERTSFLVRVSVLRSSVPVYRDIRVPSNMNLRMFQTRVLCPVFDWDSKSVMALKYMYYLPHTCYPSGRRPLSNCKDIVFTIPYQDDFTGMMMTFNHQATDAEIIDDGDVCLVDFLQEVGHTLYYQHNLRLPLTLQLKLLQIGQEDTVELIGGTGISPPEDDLVTDGPFEQEIRGIDAFNLAIKWLQSASIHESYKKEGMRLLQIKSSKTFEPTNFDLPGARERLNRSIRHSTARTHVPITTGQSMAMIISDDPRAIRNLPRVNFLGMCKTCLKENVKLLTCGRCKSVHYCSKDCQKKDWKSHKAVCAVADHK